METTFLSCNSKVGGMFLRCGHLEKVSCVVESSEDIFLESIVFNNE